MTDGEGIGAAGTGEPLPLLLEVQDLDVAITQLERRKATLPERERLEELGGRLAALGARTATVEVQRGTLVARQAELEEQIGGLTSRREAIEQRMYAARGTAARDLQAMDEEVRHLTSRRADLEEAELEVMVAMEPLDADLATANGERAGLSTEADAARAELSAAEAMVDAELATVVAARVAAAAAVPADLLDRYETLRARMGGIGAARLVGNRCSGCHLELPAREVDRIRRLPPGTVLTCEQCGRILVPMTASDAGPGPSR
ncbi:MAG: zinc ribbon domain-containing protein [Acidimicrobiales bacterium]